MTELNLDKPQEIYELLISIAESGDTITYKGLLNNCGLETNQGTVSKVKNRILDPLIEFNFQNEEPFLSALVVNESKGIPGKGFFEIMENYGYNGPYEGEVAKNVFNQELQSIWTWEWEKKQFDDFTKSKPVSGVKHSTYNIDKDEIRLTLKDIAKNKQTVTYGELLDDVGLKLNPATVNSLVNVLDEISNENIRHDEPILASLVVRKSTGRPGIGFFKKMYSIGKFGENTDISDYENELEEVWNHTYG